MITRTMSCSHTTARLEIDLKALSHNYEVIKHQVADAKVAPVIKADAYGLGAIKLAQHLIAHGADQFFVARLNEAIDLRKALGKGPTLYVFDGLMSGQIDLFSEFNLVPVLNSPEQVSNWKSSENRIKAALHIDTGMNRLGLSIDDLQRLPKDHICLIMSHLACSDTPHHSLNSQQLQSFQNAVLGHRDIPLSLANSGGCFLDHDYHFDIVRPGISLYGGGPEGHDHSDLKAVVTLKAKIIQIHALNTGDSIGYGASFQVKRAMQVATIGIGYADGLLRCLSHKGKAYYGTHPCPIVGRISMDLTAIDVTGLNLHEGDWVDLLNQTQGIDAMAKDAGTIAYEVLTRLGPRIERIYK